MRRREPATLSSASMERARLSRMAAMAFDRDDDRFWKAGFLYVTAMTRR